MFNKQAMRSRGELSPHNLDDAEYMLAHPDGFSDDELIAAEITVDMHWQETR